jgi:hypothetical protein
MPNTSKHFLEGLAIAGSGNVGCGSMPLILSPCKKIVSHKPPHMLDCSHPLDKTEHFGRQLVKEGSLGPRVPVNWHVQMPHLPARMACNRKNGGKI